VYLFPILESIVLGFEDLSTFALGWMTYNWQISPSSHPFVTDDLVVIPALILAQFFGPQCLSKLCGTQHGVYIPKLFPLPARSGLAVSQLYDPTLGASNFVNAILEQASGASPEVRTCLQWLSAFQPLRAFLNAVKNDPASFAIPLLTRMRSIINFLGTSFVAPQVLGLGILMAVAALNPDVAALSSAWHE
jgi:hypothetical protein